METLRKRNPTLINESKPVNEPFLNRIAKADLFPKPKEDFKRSQTYVGGCISAFTFTVIMYLVLWETFSYITGRDAYLSTLTLDDNGNRSMDVHIDILFPSLQCHHISVDTLDSSGAIHYNIEKNLHKIPLTSNGMLAYRGELPFTSEKDDSNDDHANDSELSDYCPPCFLPADHSTVENMAKKDGKLNSNACCKTCEAVQKAYKDAGLDVPSIRVIPQCISKLSTNEPGCNVIGTINMKKIPGNLVFLPRHTYHRFNYNNVLSFNTTHIIKKFSIGNKRVQRFSRTGVSFPLNGKSYNTPSLSEVRYFIKVVSTTYNTKEGLDSNQRSYEYSAQRSDRHFRIGSNAIPSVFFTFDISPFQINNYFLRPPFLQFMVKLCSIVGGVFVVLSIIDNVNDFFAR